MNPNRRLGTSPHRGGWVMDVETTADRFVGIDVSKARVDVHVRPDGTAFGGATDPEGLGALVRDCSRCRPVWWCSRRAAVMESVVAAALAEAGLPVAIVNPRQVRKFAGAIGRLAKTDAISTRPTLQPSLRPLTFKTVAPLSRNTASTIVQKSPSSAAASRYS
jgi:transposase